MRSRYALLLLMLFTAPAFAGNADRNHNRSRTVSGKVSAANGEELAGARIVVAETQEVFYADLEGRFQFPVKSDREYTLRVESEGHEPLHLRSGELSLFSTLTLRSLSTPLN